MNDKRYLRRKSCAEGIVYSMAFLTAVSALAPFTAITAEASTTDLSYRSRVIGLTGIMSNVNMGLNETVSRGEFAQMLVNASTYKDYLPTVSATSVYNDVPSENRYAPAIRIVAEEEWMTGYLGGNFKPDQPVTLKEAVRGLLALLGYEDDDFVGNATSSRMALYYSLELNEEVNREETEILNRTDCINLFYNLLKATMKNSNTVYGTVLGCSVNSDGEINPMDLADTSLIGPKLVPKGKNIGNYVPFNIQEASIYLNGNPSTYERAKTAISNGYAVIYYNTQAKTVWIYTVDDELEDSGRCAIRGTVTGIIYKSSDTMTPSAVILDDDEDRRYNLDSSSMQFAFSIYGTVQVGDRVVLVCDKTTNSSGDTVYSVMDYIED